MPELERHTKIQVRLVVIATFCLLALGTVPGAQAQSSADQATELAKQVQNPLANLVTLPFQANFNDGVGEFDRTNFNLNVQPVVPFPGEKWNVIARAIIPVNLLLGYYENSEHPEGAADSQVRIQVNFMFPTKGK